MNIEIMHLKHRDKFYKKYPDGEIVEFRVWDVWNDLDGRWFVEALCDDYVFRFEERDEHFLWTNPDAT